MVHTAKNSPPSKPRSRCFTRIKKKSTNTKWALFHVCHGCVEGGSGAKPLLLCQTRDCRSMHHATCCAKRGGVVRKDGTSLKRCPLCVSENDVIEEGVNDKFSKDSPMDHEKLANNVEFCTAAINVILARERRGTTTHHVLVLDGCMAYTTAMLRSMARSRGVQGRLVVHCPNMHRSAYKLLRRHNNIDHLECIKVGTYMANIHRDSPDLRFCAIWLDYCGSMHGAARPAVQGGVTSPYEDMRRALEYGLDDEDCVLGMTFAKRCHAAGEIEVFYDEYPVIAHEMHWTVKSVNVMDHQKSKVVTMFARQSK
jgi:Zn ribbon nucleic-acid-binding protein